VRLSGPDSLAIADSVFRGKTALGRAASHTLHHGMLVGPEGSQVDEVIAALFRAPHSYTGEDVVEISCHGGLFVTDAVLGVLLGAGARQAAPGEFTRRAFLNGKMDLSQAEAVAALIASGSTRAHRASVDQLNGRLAGAVGEIRDAMIALCALLEIDLDFSEEGIAVIARDEIERKILSAKSRLEAMADTFRTGRLYRDGVSVVIAGKPNAGKSSLFNALLKDARAIVTPVAGTTRDYLEESVTLSGVLFRLTDTAGLREARDPVEREGILRSLKSLDGADVVLLVDDLAASNATPRELLRDITPSPHQIVMIIRNKTDIVPGTTAQSRSFRSGELEGREVFLSAVTGEGVHLLTEELIGLVAEPGIESHESVQITGRRHWESLTRSVVSLEAGLKSLRQGRTNEFVAFDIRESLTALGEITGEVTSDEVLNSVFSAFCVGK
jgi:tRNA modification GTPase